MMRTVHELRQGSDEWHRFRLEHNGASEAAAMLGLSKKVTRSDLMRMKHCEIPREFSDWVQKNILDYGHEVEERARPIVEAMIGEELYPATYSYGKLSASCDGLTMDGETAFEHKQWNAALAQAVRMGVLPDEHQPQCQQILLVTGAKRVIFVCSDAAENMVCMEVFADKSWQQKIVAGWSQFDADLATYQPQEVIPAAVAAPITDLPALAIEITGRVVASNLAQWRDVVTARIAEINTKLQSDNDFATAEKTVKFLEDGEKRIALVKAQAQAQATDIDTIFRAMDDISAEMRAKRLELDKLVKARKESIRAEIVAQGRTSIEAHVEMLNKRIGKPWMPRAVPDFAGAIKGKKTITSLRDAVDTELARSKIAANEAADRIELNLNRLRELAKGCESLFADAQTLVMKDADALEAIVKQRIAEHKAAEVKRLDAERERIRAEEAERADAEARARTDPGARVYQSPETQPTVNQTIAQAGAHGAAGERMAAQAAPTNPNLWQTSRDRVVSMLDRLTVAELALVEQYIERQGWKEAA